MTSPLRIQMMRRFIHFGCRELGIDGETRHDLQLLVTGKASMTDMDASDLEKLVEALRNRGFKPNFTGSSKGGSKTRRAPSPRADVRFCHVMWKLLVEAGAVAAPGRAGLNGFIRARFAKAWGSVPIDVDAMSDFRQIADVVEALKAMCGRAGITLR